MAVTLTRCGSGGCRGLGEGGECRVEDLVLVGQCGALEVLGVGHRDLGHADARDRRVEVVEAGLLDPSGDLGLDAVGRPPLLDGGTDRGSHEALLGDWGVEHAVGTHSSSSPAVILYAPSNTPTSSPMRKTPVFELLAE